MRFYEHRSRFGYITMESPFSNAHGLRWSIPAFHTSLLLLAQSRPAFEGVEGVRVRLGAGADELGAPPKIEESISAIGLPACPRGGGIAKYRVAISVSALRTPGAVRGPPLLW